MNHEWSHSEAGKRISMPELSDLLRYTDDPLIPEGWTESAWTDASVAIRFVNKLMSTVAQRAITGDEGFVVQFRGTQKLPIDSITQRNGGVPDYEIMLPRGDPYLIQEGQLLLRQPHGWTGEPQIVPAMSIEIDRLTTKLHQTMTNAVHVQVHPYHTPHPST